MQRNLSPLHFSFPHDHFLIRPIQQARARPACSLCFLVLILAPGHVEGLTAELWMGSALSIFKQFDRAVILNGISIFIFANPATRHTARSNAFDLGLSASAGDNEWFECHFRCAFVYNSEKLVDIIMVSSPFRQHSDIHIN